jgi:hypothetical protein
MPKVTVYVSDDQLDQLKAVRGFGRGGVSKLFQAFLDTATSGQEPTGRYDYVRKVMPLHAAIERHRRRLARKVQAGGPPADGGPVSAALAILLYKRLVESAPDRAAEFDKELARFGLDELVASETDGVDLLAEPAEDEEVEEDDEGLSIFGPDFLSRFADVRIGESVQDALKQVQAIKVGLRDLKHDERAIRRVARRADRSGRTRLRVVVSSDDDPRDVLTATDFDTFKARHDDWKVEAKLTPSQMETVRELLVRRAGGDPEEEDADVEVEVQAEVDAEVDAAVAETTAKAKAEADLAAGADDGEEGGR